MSAVFHLDMGDIYYGNMCNRFSIGSFGLVSRTRLFMRQKFYLIDAKVLCQRISNRLKSKEIKLNIFI